MADDSNSYATDGRVIFHVDLDCFFVQVHRKLNPDLVAKPLAVHQHKDIIAVSYEGIYF